MYKWLNRVMRYLRLIYEFLFIVLIIDFGICLSGADKMRLKSLVVLGGILIISYIARDYLTHAISLFIVHAILGLLTYLFLGDLYMSIILCIAIFGIFLDASVYMKRGYVLKRTFDAPWDVFVVGLAVSILATYKHDTELQTIGYVSAVIMVVIYLINLYLEGLLNYMILNRRVVGIPMNQMVSVNSFIVTTVILIVIVTIILADLLGFPKLVGGFVIAMLSILRIVFLLLGVLIGLVAALFGYNKMRPQEQLSRAIDIAEEESIVSRVFYFILVAAFLALMAYILIRICIHIIKWLISRQDKNFETIENLKPKKKKRITRTPIEREEGPGVLSNEQRARRIYRKKVLTFRRFFLPDRCDTAKDIEEAMLRYPDSSAVKSKSDREEIINDYIEQKRTLTELYEKVRYGNVVPDKEYLKKMKEL